MVSLFTGLESGSGSSQLTRSSQLNALGRGRAGARVAAVGFPSHGHRSPDAVSTRSFSSRWIRIRRHPRRLLPRCRSRTQARSPWQRRKRGRAAPCRVRVLTNGSSHLLRVRAPPPQVQPSPAPVAQRGHGGSRSIRGLGPLPPCSLAT